MAGLDKLLSRLDADCEEQCAAIEADAAMRAQEIFSQAEREQKTQTEKILADAQKEAELIVKKAESAASLNARRAMLSAKVDVIDTTLADAVRKLRSLDAADYFKILAHLAEKQKQPGTGVLFLSEADRRRMPEDFPRMLEDITVSETGIDIRDGFVLKYGDIEINCTFDSMVSASREDLKALAGEILFG